MSDACPHPAIELPADNPNYDRLSREDWAWVWKLLNTHVPADAVEAARRDRLLGEINHNATMSVFTDAARDACR